MGVRGDLVASALGPLGAPPDLLEKVDRAFSFGIIFKDMVIARMFMDMRHLVW